jgi:hypothetical protein
MQFAKISTKLFSTISSRAATRAVQPIRANNVLKTTTLFTPISSQTQVRGMAKLYVGNVSWSASEVEN